MTRRIAILGTRGIPARHGGFETFAEFLSTYLVERGWDVSVYCQADGAGPISEDTWHGVHRVVIPIERSGAVGTMQFDWRSIRHAIRAGHRLVLTLGYNTAAFCVAYRLKGIRNIINMDGLEWKRDKWSTPARLWLWLNERCGCWFGNHLVADHPEIANHLATRVSRAKITMIPYGAPEIVSADPQAITSYGAVKGRFAVVIARAEPENSLLEIVKAFSRKRRGFELVVLGNYDVANNPFHRLVKDSASEEVRFVGAIYDKSVVQSFRQHARFYVHGHRVGGTNPSLVEALGAGSPVLAHDNPFNRWVAGSAGRYFQTEDDCERAFDELIESDGAIASMRRASEERLQAAFRLDDVLGQYETLLQAWDD